MTFFLENYVYTQSQNINSNAFRFTGICFHFAMSATSELVLKEFYQVPIYL